MEISLGLNNKVLDVESKTAYFSRFAENVIQIFNSWYQFNFSTCIKKLSKTAENSSVCSVLKSN